MRKALSDYCGRRLTVYAKVERQNKYGFTLVTEVRNYTDNHLLADHLWIDCPVKLKSGQIISFRGGVYQYIRRRLYKPDYSIKPDSQPIIWR
ncbi:hypothetical protein E6E07_09340 [Escherichia coli]|nr:hypothetical protein [Escherichia coli]EFN4539152.1 hypothetical protein [Escherichia coli]